MNSAKVRSIRRKTPGPASVEDITPKTKRQKQKRRSPEGKAAFSFDRDT
jgi:hypothetical protein